MHTQLQRHKFNLFPKASEEDFARLLDDMRANGYDDTMPITLYQGAILDGWNRYCAATELGLTPATVEFDGDDGAALEYTLRTNKRRNMSSSQWAAVAVAAEDILTAIREQVEAQRRAKQAATQAAVLSDKKLSDSSDDEHASKAATKVAEVFNTNRTYVNEAKKIKESNPEAFDKVLAGEATITQVKREIKEQQREARREENRAKVAEVVEPEQVAQAGARFATIVIDPPWDWGDEGDQDQLGRARPDYATMSLSQLLDLPVGDMADEDCHIYLWITNRSLPKGFQLLERWGFRYITALTWVKPHFGMGNYFRGQTEHVLFGVKGSQALKRKDAGTVFHAARGPAGHSSKPAEFYDLVETCSPGPYLEMFSRSQRSDWTAWGENANARV